MPGPNRDSSGSKVLASNDRLLISQELELPLTPSSSKLTQETFRHLFEAGADAMVIADSQGRILRMNSQTHTMFGHQEDQLIGQSVERLMPERYRLGHSDHRAHFMAAARRLPMGEGLVLFGLRKDGTEFPIEISLSPLETEIGIVVISTIRDVSERKNAEEMRQRLAFETTLSELSAAFINLPADRVDQEIVNGLRLLGEALDADRGALGQVDPQTGGFIVTHFWTRPGFPQFPERIIANTLPWLESRILRGEISYTERPDDLPPEAIRERKFMEAQGQKSSLVAPLRIGGKPAGAMSSGSFRKYQKWDSVVIARFQLAAEIFANALSRKQADENLHLAYSEIRLLKEQLERENVYLREEIKLEHSHSGVVGNGAAIRAVLKKVEQVASTPSAVLILGETGTGKELIARTIHDLSTCKDRPMVKINCAALPASLIESELFGREKGAYTGALSKEIGRFELADRSTIFLDEIGELPVELQAKLLRVLQEGEFERLGSSKTIRVEVRVIAATSRDLQAMVKEGKFREDLFYRLNVFPILIPPLRDRPEDMPLLVSHTLKDLGKRMGRSVEGIKASTLKSFQGYSWPGNVRELRNVIERNLILHPGPLFQADPLDLNFAAGRETSPLNVVESDHIRQVLQSTHWRIRGQGGAAAVLRMKPTTLESRIKKLGIRRPV
ncbi:MAG TPA: sigma 54-interacting transcriptional regulator [Candidatus Acidoferrum sp.]|jgi:PAS domain S-box-containing protein